MTHHLPLPRRSTTNFTSSANMKIPTPEPMPTHRSHGRDRRIPSSSLNSGTSSPLFWQTPPRPLLYLMPRIEVPPKSIRLVRADPSEPGLLVPVHENRLTTLSTHRAMRTPFHQPRSRQWRSPFFVVCIELRRTAFLPAGSRTRWE